MSGFSEDDLAAALRRVLSGEHPGVRVGVGDDAAVVEPGRHPTLLAVDMLVEGVDFDRGTTSARDLGYKAMSVNVSDIAAMGGSPRFAVMALGLPPGTDPGWVVELTSGMREAADEHGAAVVGGDLSRAETVVVSVTITGEVPEGGAVTRAGAAPGDLLVVTGTLGAAAGGLRLLQAPPQSVAHVMGSPWAGDLVAAQLRPQARVGEGRILARNGATAMIDVSDGLAKDLSRLCKESGVGALVRLEEVPVAGALLELDKVMPIDPLLLALEGGEDFELLAAIGEEGAARAAAEMHERFGTSLATIGQARKEPGLVGVSAGGAERAIEPRGWDHFAGRGG